MFEKAGGEIGLLQPEVEYSDSRYCIPYGKIEILFQTLITRFANRIRQIQYLKSVPDLHDNNDESIRLYSHVWYMSKNNHCSISKNMLPHPNNRPTPKPQ